MKSSISQKNNQLNNLNQMIIYSAQDTFKPDRGLQTHFRFYFFEKGSGIISIDNNKISFIAPCCLCINEREKVDVQSINDYRLLTINFVPCIINSAFNFENIRSGRENFNQSEILDLYWLKTFLDHDESFNGIMQVGPSTAQRIKTLCSNIGDELFKKSDNFWPCRTRSFFYELLNLLNLISANPCRSEHLSESMDSSDFNAVIQYLNNNYHRKITITELTEFFDINRTTLSRRFLKLTGMSVMSYLTKIRIKMACLLLKDTTLPVAEIMYRTGFEDSTHFGRVFKKETSFSPSQYRGKNC